MRNGKFMSALAMFVGVCAFTNRASACYDPSLGRWLQQDPAGYKGGNDLYMAYNDDPINRVDPYGRLGYRTTVAPVADQCASSSEWDVEWTGIPQGFSGWIIQRIDLDQGITYCDTGKIRPPDIYPNPYWEGFQVTNGQTDDEDSWKFSLVNSPTHGVEGKQGSAQLYSSSFTQLPWPFEESIEGSPPNGLMVSFIDPAPYITGHGFAPLGTPAVRTMTQMWNCCCGLKKGFLIYQ